LYAFLISLITSVQNNSHSLRLLLFSYSPMSRCLTSCWSCRCA
jgi:hypothetical protein